MYLGDEDDSESLKEGCAIHVDGGTERQHKASNGVADAMLSCTAQRDGQASNAGVSCKHCDQSLSEGPANQDKRMLS